MSTRHSKLQSGGTDMKRALDGKLAEPQGYETARSRQWRTCKSPGMAIVGTLPLKQPFKPAWLTAAKAARTHEKTPSVQLLHMAASTLAHQLCSSVKSRKKNLQVASSFCMELGCPQCGTMSASTKHLRR